MLGQRIIALVQGKLPGSVRSLVPQSLRIRIAGVLGKLDDRDEALMAAKAATEAKDWTEAACRWRTVLDNESGYGAEFARVRLAESLRILARLDEAEEALTSERGGPVGPEAKIEYARVAMVRGDWPEAVRRWRACYADLDRYQHAVTGISQSLRMTDAFDEAETLVGRSLARDPDSFSLMTEFARIAAERKDWPQAATRWQNVLDCHGKHASAEACFGLFIALKSLGEHDQASKVFQDYQAQGSEASYAKWIANFDALDEQDRSMILSDIDSLEYRPTFSILMPVYNTDHGVLREALDSVLGQLYGGWELCVADDASPDEGVRAILEEYAARDTRVKPIFQQENGGIAVATNSALEVATGDWIALMDHDDLLAPHALYMFAERLNRSSGASIVYSDEDHVDQFGVRSNPYFKPDFNYDLLLGQNLFNHLTAYRADLAKSVGGFRKGFDGSQDWDFALRVLDAEPDGRIEHIPFVLYHWRQTGQNFSAKSLDRAVSAAERAVNEHLVRRNTGAVAAPMGSSSHLRVKWPLPSNKPLVSAIIPTKDRVELLSVCVDGLLNRTDYAPIEIVIVDNGSTEPETLEYLQDLRTRPNVVVADHRAPFNFSRLINLGVEKSTGDVLLLLNNDIDVINEDWLTELVSHAIRPDVGAVGAKLYYHNDTIQHGGVVLGVGGASEADGVAGHAFKLFPRNSGGYINRLHLTHQLSSVTAACVAVRRSVFDEVGGFEEENLAVAFNDIDFCLRVSRAGYRIIWTPGAELYHYESISRGEDKTPEKVERFRKEFAYMRDNWGDVLINDPFYNPNLTLLEEGYEISQTPRAVKPWVKP